MSGVDENHISECSQNVTPENSPIDDSQLKFRNPVPIVDIFLDCDMFLEYPTGDPQFFHDNEFYNCALRPVSDCKQKDKDFIIRFGICARDKKVFCEPMREMIRLLNQNKHLEIIIIPDCVVCNFNVEFWPAVDALLSFYSKDFDLPKVMKYCDIIRPLLINDLSMQSVLKSRKEVYKMLKEEGIPVPNYVIIRRDPVTNELLDQEDIVIDDDFISYKGVVINKPLVEKPISAENHNVWIYFQSSAGGGCQRLFRKVNNLSSVYCSESVFRNRGSYLYEDFVSTEGSDLKVYAVGPYYAHAEARKSPSLDGKVERDQKGKEMRYPVILNRTEKSYARKICRKLKHMICGFDILRSNNKSYVCDVNGFSCVKNSKSYTTDCATIITEHVLTHYYYQLLPPGIQNSLPSSLNDSERTEKKQLELRCVVGVFRHGDRTPKQKLKMVVQHPKFVEIFQKNGGNMDSSVKLKKPKQLEDILNVTRYMIEEETGDIFENRTKLLQMRHVLEMYGHFSGINRKVQLKSLSDDRNRILWHKLRPNVEGCHEVPHSRDEANGRFLLLVLKWGGELNSAGRKQAEELGRSFRNIYPSLSNEEFPMSSNVGLLRLHSTYRHDLKIYASDEGRVQLTAAAFARGMLALEGELTPILVHLVDSDKNTTEMLDTGTDVEFKLEDAKSTLHELLSQDIEIDDNFINQVNPTHSPVINESLTGINNPVQVCARMHALIKLVCSRIKKVIEENSVVKEDEAPSETSNADDDDKSDKRLEESSSAPLVSPTSHTLSVSSDSTILQSESLHKNTICGSSEKLKKQRISSSESVGTDDSQAQKDLLYASETFSLMERRWSKLEKDFLFPSGKYNISLIPDIYDCVKYDYMHNLAIFADQEYFHTLYQLSKLLAYVVIPQEYGISKSDKLFIGTGICKSLFKKIQNDLLLAIKDRNSTKNLNYTERDKKHQTEQFRSRFYFTSESHMYSILNVFRHGSLFNIENFSENSLSDFERKIHQDHWEKTINFIDATPHCDFMSHFMIFLYEDPDSDMNSPFRHIVEIYFSPGDLRCPESLLKSKGDTSGTNQKIPSPLDGLASVGDRSRLSSVERYYPPCDECNAEQNGKSCENCESKMEKSKLLEGSHNIPLCKCASYINYSKRSKLRTSKRGYIKTIRSVHPLVPLCMPITHHHMNRFLSLF